MNLVDDLVGNFAFTPRQGQLGKVAPRVANRQVNDIRNVVVIHVHMARLFAQPRAAAGGTRLHGDILGEIITHHVGFGFPIAALHVGQHAFKGMLPGDFAAAIPHVHERNLLIAATVEDDLTLVASQLLPGGFQLEAVVLGECLQLGEIVNVAPIPAFNDAFCEGKLWMANQLIWVKVLLNAEAITGRAGARRVVKREHARLKL